MRIWVILGVFPVTNDAAGGSSCMCPEWCLGSELGGSQVWEWPPAGMPRWFSRRLCRFPSSPAFACSGGSLPSEALGAPRCPPAGVSAGRAVRRWEVGCAPPHAGEAQRRLLSRSRRCVRVLLLRSACLRRCLLASLFPVDSQAFACSRYRSFAGCAFSVSSPSKKESFISLQS